MIPGYNHNIRHKGVVFHVQTEDSGIANPHVITHLFIGGNIINSKKTSYADIVSSDRLEDVVREIMEEQHKQMLRDLKNGVFDDRVPGQAAKPAAPEPEQKAAEEEAVDIDAPADAAADDGGERSLDEVILDFLAEYDT